MVAMKNLKIKKTFFKSSTNKQVERVSFLDKKGKPLVEIDKIGDNYFMTFLEDKAMEFFETPSECFYRK